MSEPDAKKRRPGRFTPQISSNVENFPTIVISHKNFLLTVSSFTTNSNDEVVELICENRESVQETIKIHLSDIWSGTNVSVGSVLRVIDPLWVGENVINFLKYWLILNHNLRNMRYHPWMDYSFWSPRSWSHPPVFSNHYIARVKQFFKVFSHSC